MDLPNCAARRQADGQGDPHYEARLSRLRDEKERVKVAGAAAAIVVQVLLHANELNAMAVGSMKCEECGFLALRNLYTERLDGAPLWFRQKGRPPRRRIPESDRPPPLQTRPLIGHRLMGASPVDHVVHDPIPVCYEGRRQFREDFIEAFGEQPSADDELQGNRFVELLRERQPCGTNWIPDNSPREHHEKHERGRERLRDSALALLAVFGVVGAAVISYLGASIQADATRDAAREQIRAQATLQERVLSATAVLTAFEPTATTVPTP
jgi:hypothetical protein